MKILIDIGHPAHVHYFKNVISQLQNRGHSVFVVARKKEVSFRLLTAYNISFTSRGKGKNSLLGKFFYLFKGTYVVYKQAKMNKIDLFVSFASPYNALASILYKKPVITLDDTEHNVFNHKIYTKLSSSILTPKYFKKEFGEKHIRFSATMESAYLHSEYFISENLTFSKPQTKDKNVLLRFVSWQASHDVNQKGFTNSDIKLLIKELSQVVNVHISSEKNLPQEFSKYAIKIAPEKIHHYLKTVDLFIGESGTMATEASYLGTHAIVLNSASNEFGVFDWFSNFETFYIAKDFNDLLNKAKELLNTPDLKFIAESALNEINQAEISLTDFLIWFIENYPQSATIMKENPDYQYKFR
ncbi:MAG: DUF354 domain-containing protein [Tenuifilaceae bacterium]|nr:DUF354 domain-containing protein [Tenuifilaceae bacterium]